MTLAWEPTLPRRTFEELEFSPVAFPLMEFTPWSFAGDVSGRESCGMKAGPWFPAGKSPMKSPGNCVRASMGFPAVASPTLIFRSMLEGRSIEKIVVFVAGGVAAVCSSR